MADETTRFTITMQHHEFDPLELVVPAEQEFTIIVKNRDTMPIEFKSTQLNCIKIIQPGSDVSIAFSPLPSGTYRYIDDFNRDVKGFITAK